MSSMESLGQRVKREMAARRPPLKGYQLATLLHRQQSYVSKLVNDNLKDTPPPDVLHGLELVLGISREWSLRALGYLDTEPAGSNIAESSPVYDDDLAREIAQLPDDDRAAVRGFLAYLRSERADNTSRLRVGPLPIALEPDS